MNAEQLKAQFDVHGFFYNLRGKQYRSCLEIVRKDSNVKSSKLMDQVPDAIVTMMNPGSSRPLTKDVEPHIVSSYFEADKLLLKGKLILTRPDHTQYQVERIMVMMKWKHVRVINLADLREPKSPDFLKTIHREINPYSIFSSERRITLDRLFQSRTVICGWGLSRKLSPLIIPAMEYVKQRGIKIVGKQMEKNSIFFGHPSPMVQQHKLEWLEEIKRQLN